MKKIVDEIRKWATLAAFCAAAVLFYLNNAKLDTIESAVKELETFQDVQDQINAKEGIVYEYFKKQIMGIEIPGEDETE